jgi:hypothetical protein
MCKANPTFRIYSPRPALVDSIEHKEIHPFIPEITGMRKAALTVVGPPVRKFWLDQVSPTKPLGKVLTELAMGEGKPLEGPGIEGEGRTLRNTALRRLGGW